MHTKPRLPDFDSLMNMHQQDPEGYERFRKRLLHDAVSDAPSQHQKNMQYLLMRIEIAREAAETPLEALGLAVELMRNSLEELNEAFRCLQHELSNLQSLLVLERAMHGSQPVQTSRQDEDPEA